MIPVAESVPVRRTPWVTGVLAAICVLMFLYELSLPSGALDRFIQHWGASPHMILAVLSGDPRVPPTELVTLITSQFLHGGWLHLLGNMIFLWVFGRAVEDNLGHLTYLIVYLMGGAGAGIVQSWASGPEPGLTLIGASGAIAAVLGIYLVFFPTAWVRVLVPVAFFFWFFDVPAVLMLALWFFGQFFSGIASITEAAAPGYVAVWAHVGGFVLGVAAGIALPRAAPAGPRGGPAARRGTEGPGPTGLISSVSTLAALALGARILFHFFSVPPGPDLVGQIAALAYGVTNPVVQPLGELVPWLIVLGMPFDLPALVVMMLVYIASGVLIHAISGGAPRPPRRRDW